MIDHEKIIPELLERIEMLETLEEDLRWRMDQICKKLSMEQEEAKPEPKYKVGDTVYRLNDEYGISKFRIVDIDLASDEMYLSHEGDEDGEEYEYWWTDEQLYPTRESLIQSQIEHWQNMLEDEEPKVCEHEGDGERYLPEGMPVSYQCKKCREFYR